MIFKLNTTQLFTWLCFISTNHRCPHSISRFKSGGYCYVKMLEKGTKNIPDLFFI